MAETEKTLFVNDERIGEVWAAFLTKLGLYVEKKTLENYPTTEAMATAITTALTNYVNSDELASELENALKNYMTESEVNAAIASAISGTEGGFTLAAVDTLPSAEEAKPNVIYLVPKENAKSDDARDEFIYLNNSWERIGSTELDLSNYWSKDELTPMTAEELAAILV